MIYYIAARYESRLKMCSWKAEIEELGHRVQARWLGGKHSWLDTRGDVPLTTKRLWAEEDVADVFACDELIAVNPPEGSGPGRGGRHTEVGIAIARGIPIHVIGRRENIFHFLSQVTVYETFEDFLKCLPEFGS